MPIGPQVNGEYQTAAQNQELAANGFSHGMEDALQGNTDNLNKMLASLNSPATLDSHAAQAGDVLYGEGGYTPGTTFSKEGAAFGSAADLQAGDAILNGQQNAQALKIKAIVADQGFQSKIAELAGKLPGDIQTNYLHLKTLALSDAKFREQVSKDKFDQSYKTAQYKLSADKYATSVQEFNARQTLAENKFAQQTLQQNRMYAISMAHLGIAEKGLQMKIAANAFKAANGGYTPTQVRGFNNKLDALEASGAATHAVNGVSTGKDKNGNSYSTPTTTLPTPAYFDKNGKPIKVGPDGQPVSRPYRSTNTLTYTNFIRGALRKGVPIQLAIDRANTIWPITERDDLGALGQLPAIAAEAAKQAAAYNRMTGVTLGTSPNGVGITWQAPKNLPKVAREKVGQVLNLASEYLGTPYAWGGESPTGFDCSGLAQYLYAKVGIQIPRTSYAQFQGGLSVPNNQLEAGDLVFFKGSDSQNGLPGHVGIYVGGGMFVEAPHTGDVVKVSKLAGYPDYMGARRYVHS